MNAVTPGGASTERISLSVDAVQALADLGGIHARTARLHADVDAGRVGRREYDRARGEILGVIRSRVSVLVDECQRRGYAPEVVRAGREVMAACGQESR